MASVNKVILVGNLGRDPEIKVFPNGDQVANVSLATTDKWRDKQTGETKEHTEWHRLVFNGRLAEIAGQYLRKGSQIYVEGSIRTRKWTDQQSGQDRYSTEIRVDQMQVLLLLFTILVTRMNTNQCQDMVFHFHKAYIHGAEQCRLLCNIICQTYMQH